MMIYFIKHSIKKISERRPKGFGWAGSKTGHFLKKSEKNIAKNKTFFYFVILGGLNR